jgi:starch synthase (maltosyl-transferring)
VLHECSDDATLVYSKSKRTTPEGTLAGGSPAAGDADAAAGNQDIDTLIVVVNTDPHGAREGMARMDLAALELRPQDLDAEGRFTVRDLLSGQQWQWGAENYVRLDPYVEPAHVLHVVRGT